MLSTLNKDFLKSQEKALRPYVKALVLKLKEFNISEFNTLLKSTLKEESNLSEIVGELRAKFVSQFNLGQNTSDYALEVALTSIITQLVRNSNIVQVVSHVEKHDGKFVTSYRVNPIGFEALDRKKFYEVSDNFESTDKLKFKGHTLINKTVSDSVYEAQLASETDFRAKYFDKRMFDLHAFLLYIKDVDGIKHSKVQFKQYLWNQAQLGYNLCNSEFKIVKFYDTRGRGYANSVFGSFKPLGNHFESRLVELAESYTTTTKDIEYAKWLLWTDLKGRMPMAQALQEFSSFAVIKEVNANNSKIAHSYNEMLRYKTLKRGETVDVITPNQLGDMLYFNAVAKLIREGEGEESNLLLEVDMTNSGLIHFANNIRTEKLLTLANLYDETTVHDSHTNLTNSFLSEIDQQILELQAQL